MLNIPKAHAFHHEYSSLACTVEIVDDVYAAIDHINTYGRHVTVEYVIWNMLKLIVTVVYLIWNMSKLNIFHLCSLYSASNDTYGSELWVSKECVTFYPSLWQFAYWLHHCRRSWSCRGVSTPSRQVFYELSVHSWLLFLSEMDVYGGSYFSQSYVLQPLIICLLFNSGPWQFILVNKPLLSSNKLL